MKIGRIGKIENKGGIINFGEIHGNVVAGIDSAYKRTENSNTDILEKLHHEFLALADLIKNNAAEIDNPDQTLKRLRKLSEEAFSNDADQTVVERYLELIGSTTSKVVPIIESINSIKSLILGLF